MRTSYSKDLDADAVSVAHPFQKTVLQHMLARRYRVFEVQRYGGIRLVFVSDDQRESWLISPNGQPVAPGNDKHFKKGGVIAITTEKTNTAVTVPIRPALASAIRACPPTGLYLLESSHGRPWGSKESYGNTFHEWALQAGVVEKGHPKNSHGIRKAAATRLAEAGASEAELMALFGWSDPAMARLYTQAANVKKLAMQAAM